jgi:hypothetical protein
MIEKSLLKKAFILTLCLCFFSTMPVFGDTPENSFENTLVQLDRYFEEFWKSRKIKTILSKDDEYLRRVWLDLIGCIPPMEDVEEFLNADDSSKRRNLLEKLFQNRLYAENWARVWETWLIKDRLHRKFALGGQSRIFEGHLEKWLKQAIENNQPYDEMVRQLISAEGPTDENGASVFLLRWQTPTNRAILSCKIFSGLCMNCIMYHDHGDWKAEDYWKVVAFFSRAQALPIRGVEHITAMELHEGRRGETLFPGTNRIANPRFFLGNTPEINDKTHRREVFANLVTSRGNPFFARALVNRLWAYFFGRGLVLPLDAFTAVPELHPEVLDLLAKDFEANGYDLKRLMKILLSSKVYQLSSQKISKLEFPDADYAVARIKALSSEQIFHSLLEATGLKSHIREKQKRKASLHFMYLFDNSEVLEEGLDYTRTALQALFMLNSRYTNQFLLGKKSRLQSLVKNAEEIEDDLSRRKHVIEKFYLAVLSRKPREKEQDMFVSYLDENGENLSVYLDLFSVLLNSSEFLYNH